MTDIEINADEAHIKGNRYNSGVIVMLEGPQLDKEEIAKEIPLSTIFEAHTEDAIKQFGIENYGWIFNTEEDGN